MGRTEGVAGRGQRSRVQRAAAVTFVLSVALALAWLALDVLLIFFAGILTAVFLRGIANLVHRVGRIPERWSLPVGVILLVVVSAGAVTGLSRSTAEQLAGLTDDLPRAVARLESDLQQEAWGRWLLDHAPDARQLVPQRQGLMMAATSTLSGTVGIVASWLVVIFLGLYLAAEPDVYRDGLLRLIAKPQRHRFAQVMDEVANRLRWWLVGKLLSMLVIGLTTTIALLLLGIPAPIALGLIAAVLTFIPNFGPVLAAIPAILLGLLSGPLTATWVVATYTAIQLVESYVVTPLIQERTVSLPPGLTIAGQVVLGVAAGVFGLALATPLLAVALVATKRLYVEDVLEDGFDEPAARPPDPSRATAPPREASRIP